MRQYWQVFGLEEGASIEVLCFRYRQLVKKWHPDQFVGNPRHRVAAESRLKEINEAYRMLVARGVGANGEARNPSSACAISARYDIGWLQSEVALTYLPLGFAVLLAIHPAYPLIRPVVFAVGAMLVMAWAVLMREVWDNKELSAMRRVAWIVAVIAFAAVAVPMYFALHRKHRTG